MVSIPLEQIGNRPLRILYLCEYPTLLGGEQSLLALLAAAQKRIEAVVVAPSGGPLETELAFGNIARWNWPAGGKSRIVELSKAVLDASIDIVHANSLSTAEAALQLGIACGIPTIGHVRDIAKISASRLDRLSYLNHIVAVSEAVRNSLVQQRLPESRVSRIYNPVDVAKLRAGACPGKLREQLGFDSSVPLVGCVGQIALRKGQDLYLDAAETVATKLATAHFVIAGERFGGKAETVAFERELRRRSSVAPLQGRVRWIGYRSNWRELVCDLDVLAVPSRQEPLSRVLLEGVAVGVPSVATDVGGMREILVEPHLGTLTRPGDAIAMANAMLGILAKSKHHEVDRGHPGELFANRFQSDAIVDQMCDLYRRVLAD